MLSDVKKRRFNSRSGNKDKEKWTIFQKCHRRPFHRRSRCHLHCHLFSRRCPRYRHYRSCNSRPRRCLGCRRNHRRNRHRRSHWYRCCRRRRCSLRSRSLHRCRCLRCCHRLRRHRRRCRLQLAFVAAIAAVAAAIVIVPEASTTADIATAGPP